MYKYLEINTIKIYYFLLLLPIPLEIGTTTPATSLNTLNICPFLIFSTPNLTYLIWKILMKVRPQYHLVSLMML